MSKINRIVVVTCLRYDMASFCLPALAACDELDVCGVVLATGGGVNRWRERKRKIKKVLRIGVLGALNGIRMRKWYNRDYRDIEDVCRECNVRLYQVPSTNGLEMADVLQKMDADLGVSLGNGYIAPRIFSIPKWGMINVHSEILPRYQNAQSIIWPIFFRDPFSGFTIHEIARKIDAGRILYQERHPLHFFPKLADTVHWNLLKIEECVPAAIVKVCRDYKTFQDLAQDQKDGHAYTTPSIWAFLRMLWNNQMFYRQQEGF